MIFVFKEYIMEVKLTYVPRKKSEIKIHSLVDHLTVFWNPPAKGIIISAQIEDTGDHNCDGIYYISEGKQDGHLERELVRIHPMRDN